MPNPQIVSCTKDEWTKVAAGVLQATIWRFSGNNTTFFQTYRIANATAPANDDLSDAVIFGSYVKVGSAAAIDVYVYAKTNTGTVRVDS
jgi:hypothetical protein